MYGSSHTPYGSVRSYARVNYNEVNTTAMITVDRSAGMHARFIFLHIGT